MKTILPLLLLLSVQAICADRPNIVFLMTDDQRWDTLSCYGRDEYQTQNIDQLATEGITFDRAYHPVAICMPSRVSVMTGRYFASHNSGFTYPHNTPVSESDFANTYHGRLRAAGYRSGFVGKFGFNVDGGLKTLRQHFDYYDGNGTHADHGPGRWADVPGAFDGLSAGRAVTERTLKKGDSMIRFLETQPADQPFILSVSFDAVKHDSDNDMHIPDKEYFEHTEMSVPKNYYEGPNLTLPNVIKKYARAYKFHVQRLGKPEQYQEMARRFASQGRTVDSQVKRLREKLAELGLLQNTIIIYTSDNGRYIGSHGLMGKCFLHEVAVKAPLIVWDGRGILPKGQRVDALTCSTDFAPTILSLAGVPIPEEMQGESLTGLMSNAVEPHGWRDAVFMENLFNLELRSATRKARKNPELVNYEQINQDLIANNRSYRSRGVRTKRWKYFTYYEQTPVIEELYDLESDPDELHNLAASIEHQPTLVRLREKTQSLYEEYLD